MLPLNSHINSEAPERARGRSIAQRSAGTPPPYNAESRFNWGKPCWSGHGSVSGDGEGLMSHAGLVRLGEVAGRSGLTTGLSGVLVAVPRRPPRPGRDAACRSCPLQH
jgi:hypothetical protein